MLCLWLIVVLGKSLSVDLVNTEVCLFELSMLF